jgi:hypothetical protein
MNGQTELKECRGKKLEKVVVVRDYEQIDLELHFDDGTLMHVNLTPAIKVITRLLPAEKDEVRQTA